MVTKRNNRNNKPRSLPPGASNEGKKVESHPLFAEIYEMLTMRWSAEFTIKILEERYRRELNSGDMPPLPSSRTVRRYRSEHVPAKELVPASLLEEKFKQLPVKVDLFKSLQNAFRLAEERIARHTENEVKLPLPLAGVDKTYETLGRIGELLWRVGQDLGLYPRALPLDILAQMGSSRAHAQSNVFVLNGEAKSVEMMSDEELDIAELALKREVE